MNSIETRICKSVIEELRQAGFLLNLETLVAVPENLTVDECARLRNYEVNRLINAITYPLCQMFFMVHPFTTPDAKMPLKRFLEERLDSISVSLWYNTD